MKPLQLGAVAARAHMIARSVELNGASAMRSVLVLGLLITLYASANAATVHRSKPPEGHLRPGQRVTVPKGYAVPGWTDEQTRYWLDRATGKRFGP